MKRVIGGLFLLALPILGCVPPAIPATPAPPTVQPAFTAEWTQVAGGFTQPLLVTHAGDGNGRLFVVEQPGEISILAAGEVSPQQFLNIRGQVSDRYEQGLLGLAFHPGYAETPYFYISYVDLNGDMQVVRYRVSDDPNVAAADSATTVLTVEQPVAHHNGGNLVFGPDGYLYIGLGDGSSDGDSLENAQNLDTLLGKILRVDVDLAVPYGIPPDNPFASGGGLPEIWAYGLRNPWRFSFDRTTGDLYIADVGDDHREEVDYQPAGDPGGANYEWARREGFREFEGADPPPGGTPPIVDYNHQQGDCAIIGGYAYRGVTLPEYNGTYFYGDFCSGKIWTLTHDASGAPQSRLAFDTEFNISSFGEDEAGELYVVDFNGGIYKLEAGQKVTRAKCQVSRVT